MQTDKGEDRDGDHRAIGHHKGQKDGRADLNC